MIRVLYRVAWALAPLASVGTGKLARSLRGRLGAARVIDDWAARQRETARPLIWIHAASVGEGRQAEAVLKRLKTLHPEYQYVYTYGSSSAARFAEGLGADFAGYAPADTPGEAARALDVVRPSLLCYSATDVQPQLTLQAAARGIPLALVSANLAESSSRRSVLARALLTPAYAALDAVGAIDAADAERLALLGVAQNRVMVTGDTRHDSAAARAAAVDRTAPHVRALSTPGAPVLVAGSTWPSDERVLLPALERVATRLRVVIAPHEPGESQCAALQRKLALIWPAAGAVTRLSALEGRLAAGEPWQACIVDRVGVLGEVYAVAAAAYVGGGFHNAGLHAVIEPAALGVPVLFGPRWQNSRDARLLLEAGGARSVADHAGLAGALSEWHTNHTARAAAGAAARAVVDRGVGAADRTAQLLIQLAGRARAVSA